MSIFVIVWLTSNIPSFLFWLLVLGIIALAFKILDYGWSVAYRALANWQSLQDQGERQRIKRQLIMQQGEMAILRLRWQVREECKTLAAYNPLDKRFDIEIEDKV